jgi:hypothetical protein
VIRESDEFWDVEHDAIQRLERIVEGRGVQLERIFVFPNENLRQRYAGLMADQATGLTRVFYTVQVRRTWDFAIIDKTVIVIDNLLSAVRSVVPADVKKCSDEYAILKADSHEVKKGTVNETPRQTSRTIN